jgi:hypothetical protein
MSKTFADIFAETFAIPTVTDEFLKGTEFERERIIQILETTGAEFLTKPELDELLGLIKGENK